MNSTAYEAGVGTERKLSSVPTNSPVNSGTGSGTRNTGAIFLPIELAEKHPNLVDRILDVLGGQPLPQGIPCRTLWGKYQTLSLRKDGKVMGPFRG